MQGNHRHQPKVATMQVALDNAQGPISCQTQPHCFPLPVDSRAKACSCDARISASCGAGGLKKYSGWPGW